MSDATTTEYLDIDLQPTTSEKKGTTYFAKDPGSGWVLHSDDFEVKIPAKHPSQVTCQYCEAKKDVFYAERESYYMRSPMAYFCCQTCHVRGCEQNGGKPLPKDGKPRMHWIPMALIQLN